MRQLDEHAGEHDSCEDDVISVDNRYADIKKAIVCAFTDVGLSMVNEIRQFQQSKDTNKLTVNTQEVEPKLIIQNNANVENNNCLGEKNLEHKKVHEDNNEKECHDSTDDQDDLECKQNKENEKDDIVQKILKNQTVLDECEKIREDVTQPISAHCTGIQDDDDDDVDDYDVPSLLFEQEYDKAIEGWINTPPEMFHPQLFPGFDSEDHKPFPYVNDSQPPIAPVRRKPKIKCKRYVTSPNLREDGQDSSATKIRNSLSSIDNSTSTVSLISYTIHDGDKISDANHFDDYLSQSGESFSTLDSQAFPQNTSHDNFPIVDESQVHVQAYIEQHYSKCKIVRQTNRLTDDSTKTSSGKLHSSHEDSGRAKAECNKEDSETIQDRSFEQNTINESAGHSPRVKVVISTLKTNETSDNSGGVRPNNSDCQSIIGTRNDESNSYNHTNKNSTCNNSTERKIYNNISNSSIVCDRKKIDCDKGNNNGSNLKESNGSDTTSKSISNIDDGSINNNSRSCNKNSKHNDNNDISSVQSLPVPRFRLKRYQHRWNANNEIIELIGNAVTAINRQDLSNATDMLEKAKKLVERQQKLIRIADKMAENKD